MSKNLPKLSLGASAAVVLHPLDAHAPCAPWVEDRHHQSFLQSVRTSSWQILQLFNRNSLVSLLLGLIRVMTAWQISLTTIPAVALWTSRVVPNNWGPPFSTGWQQHASIFHAERSHLGASLSRFRLGLNLKREMFLGGREGEFACTPCRQ